jgi:hypothetical protein
MYEDFIVDLVSKILKNFWRFFCWFIVQDIEECVKIFLLIYSLRYRRMYGDCIVDLVSKLLMDVWRFYWKLCVFWCLYSGLKMKLSTKNSLISLAITNFYKMFGWLHVVTKEGRHCPTHNAALCHKINEPSRFTSPRIQLRVQITNLKTLCNLTVQWLSFVLTCITCCMFKAGKCYETKSSEILHKMVVTKFEGRVLSFDAR